MSWQRCATANSYPLAMPLQAVVFLFLLHILVVLYSCTLAVDSHALAIIWLGVRRSWWSVRQYSAFNRQRTLQVLPDGRLILEHNHETSRTKHGRCTAILRAPGFSAITIDNEYGKPLEILIFYRYYRRQHYARIVRFLRYSSTLSAAN